MGLYIPIKAAALFQCVIVSIMNAETRVRLEITVTNSHVKLAFELWVGGNFGLSNPTFHTKLVTVWVCTSISQQLHCSNVSL